MEAKWLFAWVMSLISTNQTIHYPEIGDCYWMIVWVNFLIEFNGYSTYSCSSLPVWLLHAPPSEWVFMPQPHSTTSTSSLFDRILMVNIALCLIAVYIYRRSCDQFWCYVFLSSLTTVKFGYCCILIDCFCKLLQKNRQNEGCKNNSRFQFAKFMDSQTKNFCCKTRHWNNYV